jgi:hypothetical protein
MTGVPLQPAKAADAGHYSQLASEAIVACPQLNSRFLQSGCRRCVCHERYVGVAGAEVILDQVEIVAPISESEPAGVSQYVRMNRRQSGSPRRGRDQVIAAPTRERLAALEYEKPARRANQRFPWRLLLPLQQLPEDVGQNPAVLVVEDLLGRVDPDGGLE